MDTFVLDLLDKLEAKELEKAKRRLTTLTDKELAILWRHYFKSVTIPYEREDTIRELASELVMDGR